MKSTEKLIKRLRDDGHNIPDDAKYRRLYHGWIQRSCGAWSWCLESSSNIVFSIGSQFTVKECLAAPYLSTLYTSGDLCVFPEKKEG